MLGLLLQCEPLLYPRSVRGVHPALFKGDHRPLPCPGLLYHQAFRRQHHADTGHDGGLQAPRAALPGPTGRGGSGGGKASGGRQGVPDWQCELRPDANRHRGGADCGCAPLPARWHARIRLYLLHLQLRVHRPAACAVRADEQGVAGGGGVLNHLFNLVALI